MTHLSKSASPHLPNSLLPYSLTSLIILLYLLLTLLLTYPLPFNLTNSVPSDIGDPLLNIWILAWDSHALLNNPLDLFNANIFYPLPNTLAYSEHLFSTALLILPFQLIFNEPVLAYNLSLLLSFPLAAFGMYLYTLRWTQNRSAAFIAGLIFGFAPYRFAAIAHLQLLTFQWLPFALLFIDKLMAGRPATGPRLQRRGWRLYGPQFRYSLALLIFLILQILASWYLALYTVVILGLYLLLALFSRKLSPSHLPSLVGVFLLALGLTLPFALPYLDLVDELRQARPLSLALSLAAAPADFLAAAPFNRLFGPLTHPFRERPNFTEENTLFIGLITPLLALTALITLLVSYTKKTSHPPIPPTPQLLPLTPYSLLLTAYFLLLLLCLALTFPTPYAALANLIPATTIVRVPPRWIIPALFALSILAALGYTLITRYYVSRFTLYASRFTPHTSHLIPILQTLLPLLTCLFLLLETLSVPLPLASVENRADLNPAYKWLAAEAKTADFALVELPLHSAPAPEYPEVKRLYASTLGWWQLVNGYSGYTPARQPLLAQALAAFPAEPAISTLQTLAAPPSMINYQLPITNYQTPIPPPPYLPLYLLVHPGEAPFDRSRWETAGRWQAERNPALRPLGQFEGDYLYQVLPPDPQRFAAPPLATFGSDRTIQLLKIDFIPALAGATPSPTQLALFWRPTGVLTADYTLFIHLRAADGFVRSQADGPPVGNHYPTRLWQSDEIIQDIHALPSEDFSQVDHLAIGLYNGITGERLPAFDINGARLADDALVIPVP